MEKVTAMKKRLEVQDGIAMLTVMLLMLMLTVLGVAAITVSGLEINMAGMQRSTEAASVAAESGIGTAVNILRQTIDDGSIPAGYIGGSNPVPTASANPSTGASLADEINGRSDNDADSVTASPDLVLPSVGAFTVSCDIDRLYSRTKSGSAIMFASAYDGVGAGAGGGGVEFVYRIDCLATNTATNTNSRTVAVYSCNFTSETCQKKI
jgi:Tfp pilus assembly protein PilX